MDFERLRLNVEEDGRLVLDRLLKFKILVLRSSDWLSLDASKI